LTSRCPDLSPGPKTYTPGSWPDTNGYLGDSVNPADDPTTIGARQYNPPVRVRRRFALPLRDGGGS
jgi:hypothetical protein